MIADFIRPFHLTRRDKSEDDHCNEVRANVYIKEMFGSTFLNLENAHDNQCLVNPYCNQKVEHFLQHYKLVS